MSSSRWQTISQIFEAALDLPAGERESFVHKACNGDPGIEAEVIRLLAGDENAGSFLEHPALSTLPARTTPRSSILLSEGLIVGDRFRIVRFIGQGGMGQVYEALDLELNSRIALKVIRPEIAVDERMLSRFRREVQLTRMITHPNVCRTFDIERQPIPAETGGDAKSLSFLTMELLEGETLSSLLRRQGRMSVNEALPLADQMIDALAAAHAVGVIHRDFKPSNILLVPAGATRTALGSGASSSRLIASGSPGSSSGPALRAVVTDFGLARIVTSDISEHETGSVAHSTSLTGDQALMGTLVYMAPEQFERGEVSMASDIYSLGLVLFEMVTGQRPFADDIPFAEATKRLKQPAPLPSSLVPEIPAIWDAVISRCLALDPNERFKSVLQAAGALHDPAATAATALATHKPTSRQPARRKILAALAIVAVLVSLSMAGLRLYLRRQSPIQFAERDWILVTDITNQTGEKLFDRVVRDLAVESLSQSSYINIVPRLSALQAAKRTGLKEVSAIDEKLGRELCLHENYKALLSGSVFKNGSHYTIAMQIQITGKDSASISETETIQSPDELLAGVDRLVTRIRRDLGESLSQIETNAKPLAQVTTSSLDALQRYSAAVDLYGVGEYTRCINLANDAVGMDQSFAMAHLLLARAYEKMGNESGSRLQMDLARNDANHVGERERHLILAVGYSYQLMNEKAAEEYQHLLDIFPDDVDALKGFAYEAFWAGHSDRAIAAQRRATTLNPRDVDSYDTLMTLLIRTDQFTEALAVYKQAQTYQLTAPNLTFLYAIATWGAGDLVTAQKLFELLGNEGGSWKITATLFMGKLLAFEGRMNEAVEVFQAGLALVQTPALEYWIPNFQYQIARTEILTGNAAVSRMECERLGKAAVKVPMPINLQRGGRLLIAVGDLQSAKHLEDVSRRQVVTHPDAFSQMELHNLRGDVALASGHASEAIQEERSALAFRPWYTPYFSLGEACEAAKNWKCAIESYSRCLDFKGAILRDDAGQDWVLAHYSLARAYVESGDEASGEVYLQKFLNLFSAADPELPILLKAKRKRAQLRETDLTKSEKH